jgi:hypothetical protein
VQDQFIYTSDDVLRMLDALLAGGGFLGWLRRRGGCGWELWSPAFPTDTPRY